MFQLRSAKQMVLTLLTAPLGLIGVAWGMLLTDKAMGFVAILGVLALFGMIIRNSVILIDQIQKHLAEGEQPWDAIVDSAVLRFRPIMLTAAAAILGMVPLMPSTFWGPMAVAIASGLLVATDHVCGGLSCAARGRGVSLASPVVKVYHRGKRSILLFIGYSGEGYVCWQVFFHPLRQTC